jgi:hypothetical protein
MRPKKEPRLKLKKLMELLRWLGKFRNSCNPGKLNIATCPFIVRQCLINFLNNSACFPYPLRQQLKRALQMQP